MNLFENIRVSISGNSILLFLGLILILGYSVFVYKTTLPQISIWLKSILVFIRALALILIFILLFDPILITTTKDKIEPINLIFIDNSKSIKFISREKDINKINTISKNLQSKVNNSQLFTFSNEIRLLKDIDSLNFNNSPTQFENIIKQIKKTQNAASVTIISDGINNQGVDITNETSKFGIPFFTIGVGDTATEKDMEVQKITANEFIYAGRKTEIEVSLSNINLNGAKAEVQLIEKGKLISQQEVILSETGINRIRFSYSNEVEGEHKLVINSILNGNETNVNNNTKSILVNILPSKQKIAVISGGPSADLSIIISTLTKFEDYEIFPIIQIGGNEFLNNKSNLNVIKEAEIIFLVGFPSKATNANLLKSVFTEISNSKKSVFLAFSNNIDLAKLNDYKNILPFGISQITNTFGEAQISSQNIAYSIIGNSDEIKNWEKLPPINFTKTKINPIADSQILLIENIGKNPVLFTNASKQKFIVLNAANFWKWKIQTTEKQYQLWDNLIINSIKWLSFNKDNQKLNLKTQKKIYSIGEKVIFSANYYDDTFEPINDENIEIEISNDNNSHKIVLNSIGSGLYEGEFIPNKAGKYNYKSEINNSKFSNSFMVEPVEIENIVKNSDRNFLRQLAIATNGNYYDIDNSDEITNKLNLLYENKINYNFLDNELRLSFLHYILLIVILLFTIEWLLRKIFRML